MKSLYKSKTFWLAVGQALIAAVTIFSTTYPEVGGFLLAKSVIDIGLRMMTADPIK